MSERTEQKPKVKVIDSLWTFAVAVVTVGPLALPLLWRNPRFSLQAKLTLSVMVIGLTLYLVWVTKNQVGDVVGNLRSLREMQSTQ